MNIHEAISKKEAAEGEISEAVLAILSKLEQETGVRPQDIYVSLDYGFGIGGGNSLYTKTSISFGI